jgi:hypothetical protein
MISHNESNLDDMTISKVGLTLCDEHINAEIAPNARVFRYPYLDNVFIMESDLYGNTMPQGSCFLASHGTHGLVGKHLAVEALRNASVEEIKKLVQSNSEG